MNTFFINTSDFKISECKDLYDIYSENNELVFMDCPFSRWLDGDDGYVSCLKKMDDLIEWHYELTDAYNLIIYIDLSEHKRTADGEYSRLKSHNEAQSYVYTHMMAETIINELSAQGRRPKNTLLMFGCDKERIREGAKPANVNPVYVDEGLSALLGLPTKIQIENINKAAKDRKTFFENLNKAVGALSSDKAAKFYSDIKNAWSEKIKQAAATDDVEGNGSDNVIYFTEEALEKVKKIYRGEHEEKEIKNIFCPYEYYAGSENRRVEVVNELNIIIYLINCIRKPELFGVPFKAYDSDKLANELRDKEREFEDVFDRIKNSQDIYTDLELAPALYAPELSKFGLNKFGDEDSEPQSSLLNEIQDFTETVEKPDFSEYSYKDYDKAMNKWRDYHAEFTKSAQRYVDETLANYAVVSRGHRRRVLGEGGYRYVKDEEHKERETHTLDTAEKMANGAYKSVINRYLSARPDMQSLSATDIDDECEEFKSKKDKIEKELKQSSVVAVILLILIVALYVPFFVIQFEAITQTLLSIIIASASVAVPIALVFIVFAKVFAKRKRELDKVWKEFCAKAQEKIDANEQAMKEFTSFLTKTIPSIRYIYEYKLDVEYYDECCRVADAKIDHHSQKLSDRIKFIKRLINDVAVDRHRTDGGYAQNEPVKKITDVIDFNSAYCCGEINRKLYSIIDDSFTDGASATSQGGK